MKEQMKNKTQKLPEWFNGEHYPEGSEVTNPFSGESFYLDRTELSMYDFIIGAQMVIGDKWIEPETYAIQREVRKGLDWFIKTNAKAYMVLLD